MQRLHAQYHASQRAAQDFRVGEARSLVEVQLLIEPDADAVGDAPAAPGALVGRRLADRLDQQLLYLAPEAVALHACGTDVDHIADSGNRQRGLGDIGRQHDPAAAVAVKNTVLLGLAQAREQREHLGLARRRLVAQMLAQMVGRLANFALAGQENQYVAGIAPIAPQLVHGVGNRVVQVIVARLLERTVPLLHREHAARHHDHRRRSAARRKVVGEALRIDGGRSHDDLQVRTAWQYLAQVTEQEIDIQAALVRLVDDQRVIGLEQRVALRLRQQDTVRHQLDRGLPRQPVLKAHLKADHLAQRRLQLFGDAFGDAAGRDTPRLRVSYQLPLARRVGRLAPSMLRHRALAAAHGQRHLGQLGGLSRSGLAADNDDLVGQQGGGDLAAHRRYRQRFGERDNRFGHGTIIRRRDFCPRRLPQHDCYTFLLHTPSHLHHPQRCPPYSISPSFRGSDRWRRTFTCTAERPSSWPSPARRLPLASSAASRRTWR